MFSEGITLVLGGLGLKGVSHIGTLQAFEERNIRINRIVAAGTSSLVAAQFALGWDLEALAEHFIRFFNDNHRYLWGLERLTGVTRSRTRRVRDSFSYFLRERLYCQGNFKQLSLLEWDYIEDDLAEFFGKLTFADLEIPVAVSTIDLMEGREILLEEGTLYDALKAGIAFPGLFPPAFISGHEFVSSTFYCELPLNNVQKRDGPVVAIDIPVVSEPQRPGNIIEVLARVDELRSAAIKRKLLQHADVVYSLEGMRGHPWGNYRQIPRQISRVREEMGRLLAAD